MNFISCDGSMAWKETFNGCKTLFAYFYRLPDRRILFWMNRWDTSYDKNFVTLVLTGENGKLEKSVLP